MYFFVGIADKFLDIIGLITLLYLTIRLTLWIVRWRNRRKADSAIK